MNSDFSRIITLLRKERKISQKKAASDLGVSQALLSHYEKGIRECGLDFLVRVSDYYNVSCDYLLGRSPEPMGKTFTLNDLPDGSTEKERISNPLAFTATLNKKLISNSVNMIFSLMLKSGSESLIKNISNYLMLSIYKMFRIIYSANPSNDSNMFSVPDISYKSGADAAMFLCDGNAEAAAKGIIIGTNDAVEDYGGLNLNSTIMNEEYPGAVSSMMNLIKNSESAIKKINR